MYLRVSYPSSFFNGAQSALEEVFSDIFSSSATDSVALPAVDVAEYDSNYDLIAELPGVKKEDLKISVENRILTLSGERKHYNFPEGTRVLHHETHTRPFSRSFELPEEVHAEGISAELRDGVLRIRLPKKEQARPREVQIQ